MKLKLPKAFTLAAVNLTVFFGASFYTANDAEAQLFRRLRERWTQPVPPQQQRTPNASPYDPQRRYQPGQPNRYSGANPNLRYQTQRPNTVPQTRSPQPNQSGQPRIAQPGSPNSPTRSAEQQRFGLQSPRGSQQLPNQVQRDGVPMRRVSPIGPGQSDITTRSPTPTDTNSPRNNSLNENEFGSSIVAQDRTVPRVNQSSNPSSAILGIDIQQLGVSGRGVLVTKIGDRSKAGAAGLDVGDIITSVDQKTTHDIQSVVNAISGKKPGDYIVVGVLRQNRRFDLPIALISKPSNAATGEEQKIAVQPNRKQNPKQVDDSKVPAPPSPMDSIPQPLAQSNSEEDDLPTLLPPEPKPVEPTKDLENEVAKLKPMESDVPTVVQQSKTKASSELMPLAKPEMASKPSPPIENVVTNEPKPAKDPETLPEQESIPLPLAVESENPLDTPTTESGAPKSDVNLTSKPNDGAVEVSDFGVIVKNADDVRGVVAISIQSASMAANLGLLPEDRIVSINDELVFNSKSFQHELEEWDTSGPLKLWVIRDTRLFTLKSDQLAAQAVAKNDADTPVNPTSGSLFNGLGSALGGLMSGNQGKSNSKNAKKNNAKEKDPLAFGDEESEVSQANFEKNIESLERLPLKKKDPPSLENLDLPSPISESIKVDSKQKRIQELEAELKRLREQVKKLKTTTDT